MKNPKYILIFYSGLFKYMLLFFLFFFSLFTFHLNSQWIQEPLPVNKPITGIEFVDTLRGWACTNRGTPADTGYILYTSNSGTNWLTQFLAYNVAFTDLDMINSLTGYVSGIDYNISLDKIYYTTNGGTNWGSITMVPNMNIRDIQFLNKDSAWESGVSIGPDVRTTTDGGNTWQVRTSGISEATGRVFFLNYNTGFVAAQFKLYKTTNAGGTWTPNGNFTQSVYGVYFHDENMGWLGLSGGRIANTTNGGLNWIVQQPFPTISNLVNDIYVRGDTGWACIGAFQKIYKTVNGGLNWGYQDVTTSSSKLSVYNSLIAWTGAGGISKTTNGGGNITYSELINVSSQIPILFKLYQNYPNPFNPVTNIKFDIKKSTHVQLIITDILGRELELLVNQKLSEGSYEYKWNGLNLNSGVYFYRLITEDYNETKKMILIK